jgi:hypothetical protein
LIADLVDAFDVHALNPFSKGRIFAWGYRSGFVRRGFACEPLQLSERRKRV